MPTDYLDEHGKLKVDPLVQERLEAALSPLGPGPPPKRIRPEREALKALKAAAAAAASGGVSNWASGGWLSQLSSKSGSLLAAATGATTGTVTDEPSSGDGQGGGGGEPSGDSHNTNTQGIGSSAAAPARAGATTTRSQAAAVAAVVEKGRPQLEGMGSGSSTGALPAGAAAGSQGGTGAAAGPVSLPPFPLPQNLGPAPVSQGAASAPGPGSATLVLPQWPGQGPSGPPNAPAPAGQGLLQPPAQLQRGPGPAPLPVPVPMNSSSMAKDPPNLAAAAMWTALDLLRCVLPPGSTPELLMPCQQASSRVMGIVYSRAGNSGSGSKTYFAALFGEKGQLEMIKEFGSQDAARAHCEGVLEVAATVLRVSGGAGAGGAPANKQQMGPGGPIMLQPGQPMPQLPQQQQQAQPQQQQQPQQGPFMGAGGSGAGNLLPMKRPSDAMHSSHQGQGGHGDMRTNSLAQLAQTAPTIVGPPPQQGQGQPSPQWQPVSQWGLGLGVSPQEQQQQPPQQAMQQLQPLQLPPQMGGGMPQMLGTDGGMLPALQVSLQDAHGGGSTNALLLMMPNGQQVLVMPDGSQVALPPGAELGGSAILAQGPPIGPPQGIHGQLPQGPLPPPPPGALTIQQLMSQPPPQQQQMQGPPMGTPQHQPQPFPGVGPGDGPMGLPPGLAWPMQAMPQEQMQADAGGNGMGGSPGSMLPHAPLERQAAEVLNVLRNVDVKAASSILGLKGAGQQIKFEPGTGGGLQQVSPGAAASGLGPHGGTHSSSMQ